MLVTAAGEFVEDISSQETEDALDLLVAVVLSRRLDYADEYDLQDAISEVLDDAGIAHEREVRLDDASRLDFLIDQRVALEVKRGEVSSASSVLEQVERYIGYEEIEGVLLVSDRVSHVLPEVIDGKPVRVAHLAHLAAVPAQASASISAAGDLLTDGSAYVEGVRSHGTLVHEGSAWLVRADPDVTRRIKRNLPRWDAARRGAIALSDTEEICHELRWMLERWPVRVSREDLNRLRRGDRAHVKRLETVHAIRTGLYDPPDRFEAALEPYEHQVRGAELAIASNGLLLGDALGTGKTFTSALSVRADGGLPAIICPPPNLALQWQRELTRFYPTLTSYVVPTGPVHDIASQMPDGRFPDFVILAHSRMQKWVDDVMAQARFPTVLLEEAHEFVNPSAERSRAARQLTEQADRTIPITGTPVLNYGLDFFHLIDLAKPGSLGTIEEFKTEWCRAEGGHWLVNDPKALRAHAEECGVYLRRTMRDIGHLLPALRVYSPEVDIDLDLIEEGMAAAEAKDFARRIISKNGTGLEMMQAGSQFSAELRRLTGMAKAPGVAAFVRMLLSSRERVVLFAWHRAVIEILREHLAEFSPLLYTGSENIAEKDQNAAAFVDAAHPCRVLIMSLRSGAGLDGLQKVCQTAVFAEFDWSPARHKQALGRLHRLGQDEEVAGYFPYGDGGADPFMRGRLALKRLQSDPFIEDEIEEDEDLQIDPRHVYLLARDYLAEQGEDVERLERERDERRRAVRQLDREHRKARGELSKRLRAFEDFRDPERAALMREIRQLEVTHLDSRERLLGGEMIAFADRSDQPVDDNILFAGGPS